MVFNVSEMVYFIGLGTLGGLIYILVKSDEWEDLSTFDAIKRYLLGAVSGYIYQLLYSAYDFPNSVMCIASGYLGVDFILGIINKFKPPLKKEG